MASLLPSEPWRDTLQARLRRDYRELESDVASTPQWTASQPHVASRFRLATNSHDKGEQQARESLARYFERIVFRQRSDKRKSVRYSGREKPMDLGQVTSSTLPRVLDGAVEPVA